MHKRLIILGMTLLIVAGCVPVQENTADVELAGYATYRHPTGVFSVDLPQDWVVADASDDFAINVDFSAPGSVVPALGVYAIERAAVADLVDPDGAVQEFSLERFIDYYITTLLQTSGTEYKEIERTLQPDSSIRVSYILDSPNRTTQYNAFFQLTEPYFHVLRVNLPANNANLSRTLATVSNSYTINPGAGWVSVYQGQEESTADAITFTNLNTFAGRNNTFQIVGQIRNSSRGSLEFIEITAQLLDADGRVLVERSDFITSDLLQPGEYAPFIMTFADGAPSGTARYDLSATARYAELTTQSFYGDQNFAVSQEATFNESGLIISGQVRNEGTATANLIKVIVTVFDEEGRVIGTDTTLVDQQRLAPGEISPYAISFVELGGNPVSFIVSAQGIREE